MKSQRVPDQVIKRLELVQQRIDALANVGPRAASCALPIEVKDAVRSYLGSWCSLEDVIAWAKGEKDIPTWWRTDQ